jgi:hypothetical protein
LVPVREKALEIAGTFQLSFNSEINSEPLLLIHLLPEGEKTEGSIPRLLREFLLPFINPVNDLHFEEIFYDFSDDICKTRHIRNLIQTLHPHQ